MTDLLSELEVLALDGQAGGSTPAYGDLLELGWARCSAAGLAGPVRSRWIVPRTDRAVPWPVRELTGWSEACVADAVDERSAWHELRADLAPPGAAPTVIHFARFELPFLRDVCQRVDGTDQLPLDVVCLHAIAIRLFPELPRRNIRALAGYLGHSPELARRAAGHVEATAFIWRALIPLLAPLSVRTWGGLKEWLEDGAPRARRLRPAYPLARERRRALPDRPGVYRFRRTSGDVLYVGKAASLRKRVASHFVGRGAAGDERRLELLTQVRDLDVTETASQLEAALLETDEIKRLDPPYNVQLRAADRRAWFASPDLREATAAPDAVHRIGPLPSQHALVPLAALTALAGGASPSPALCAAAVAVPGAFAPPAALFDEGWRAFVADHLGGAESTPAVRVAWASRALWLARGRAEPEPDTTLGPTDWDLARVRRRLERALLQTGLLVRRASFLCLLAEATVAFREPGAAVARALVISGGQVRERDDVGGVLAIATWPARPAPPRRARQSCFDAATYDRLRVLVTELRRVQDEGGETALRIATHTFPPDRLARLMLTI